MIGSLLFVRLSAFPPDCLSACQPAAASLCQFDYWYLRAYITHLRKMSLMSPIYFIWHCPALFFFFCRHVNSVSTLFLDFQDLAPSFAFCFFFHITWCCLSESLVTWEAYILYAKENYLCRIYSILKNLESRKQMSSSLCILYFWLPYVQ